MRATGSAATRLPPDLRIALLISSVAVTLLQVLDVLATWLVLHHGGHEVNPVQAFVLAHWGFTGLLLDKLLCGALCAVAFYLAVAALRMPRLFAVVVSFSCAWLLLVAWIDLHALVHLV